MNIYYIILAVADDFGTIKDKNTGKINDWKGCRFQSLILPVFLSFIVPKSSATARSI